MSKVPFLPSRNGNVSFAYSMKISPATMSSGDNGFELSPLDFFYLPRRSVGNSEGIAL